MALAAFALVGALAGPAAAADDWRKSVPVLRVGFVASAGAAADLARLEPFRAYLAARIGVPVELVPSSDSADLLDAETSGRVSYAIDSAVGYVTAAAACECVEPLAEPLAADGARGYYSVLLARADSPIQDLASAAGARLAVSAADSVAGRLIPMKAFAAAGLDPATHFSAVYESAGPEDAISALLDGRADLAAAWSSLTGDAAAGYSFGVLTRLVAEDRLSMDQVRIVWRSRLIPFGPHVVRKDMPPELKTLLLGALTAMVAEAPDALDAVDPAPEGGGGFAPVTPADYAPVAELVAAL
jgi:phosphonate transport system substrate-binding protein